MLLLLLLTLIGLTAYALALRRPQRSGRHAARLLRRRFARGEIDLSEYARQVTDLHR